MLTIETGAAGTPHKLYLGQRSLPLPGSGEVLIRVRAAGINRPDLLQRRGHYPPPAGASDILGLEVAGTVVGHGPGVTLPALGSSVCALLAGGGYAEYCVAAASLCLPMPRGLSYEEAATLPETFFTVWSNLIDQGQLKAGQSILIHGGGGGIGTTAIQLARALGAEVYATSGGPEQCRRTESLGARVIDYRNEDFVERIKTLTKGKGVQLVLDIIGGKYLNGNLECLSHGGTLLLIALQGGTKTDINLLPVLQKHLKIKGSTLRHRPLAEKALMATALKQHVWPLLESRQIRPILHQTYPFQEAEKAHQVLENYEHWGKLVLTPT